MARSLMDNPYLGGYLSNIGLGLMAAAQPQPMNVNRYSMLQNTVQGANQQMMQQRLFDMQMKQAQQEQQERESRGAARATLMGGHDPSTGITWDAARQGLMDADRMSLMAQAAPETLMKAQIESLYREPKERKIVKGADGKQYYVDTGEPVLPGVKKAPQQPSTSPQKVQDEESPTGWSWVSPSGSRLAGAPPPTGGQAISVDKDGNVYVGPSTGAPTASQAGKRTIEMEDQRIALGQFLKSGSRMLSELEEAGDEAINVAGGVERFMDTLSSQGRALARRYGGESDIAKIAQSFEWDGTLAAQSAALQSQMTDMAYGLALIKNGNRPTDEDVRNMLRIISGSTVKTTVAKTVSAMRTALDDYAVRHREVYKEDWNPREFMERHNITLPGQQPSSTTDFGQMEPEELLGVDIPSLSPEQRKALEREYDRRGW